VTLALVVLLGLALGRTPAAAQSTPAPPPPVARIPAPGGEVVLASDGDRAAYDRMHYAAVRRVGDVLYLSGVVVGPGPADSAGPAAFQEQVRRAFRRIERSLAAAGASLGDVAMLRTYHVWRAPGGPATKAEHFALFAAVKDELMPAPHPAWTAVGVTELLPDRGLVEIEVVAHVPRARRAAGRPADRQAARP
jgi:enamine deaminase RidA (YjgF/YER057c/UK114 family)